MANKIITPQELVRDISEIAERIGAERGLSDEQILKLKLLGASIFSDRLCAQIQGMNEDAAGEDI